MSAKLQVIRGIGEFQTLETTILVSEPETLQFVWSTDIATAAGGNWLVTRKTAPVQVVASGKTPLATAVGKQAIFSIDANKFLQAAPPDPPGVEYSVTIAPYDSSNQPLGSASPAVTVTQQKEIQQPPVEFRPPAVFPDLELLQYTEEIGQVPQTQIHYALATLTVRAVHNGATTITDPVRVSVNDWNDLMRQRGPGANVASLKPGMSAEFTLKMEALLPPATSQLPQDEQYRHWWQQYNNRHGVDLRGSMTWSGPPELRPMGDIREVNLYKGMGDFPPRNFTPERNGFKFTNQFHNDFIPAPSVAGCRIRRSTTSSRICRSQPSRSLRPTGRCCTATCMTGK